MERTHSIGWIPFLNLHPMKVELEKKLGRQFYSFAGKPTEVNKALQAGTIDAAPSSSICLLTEPDIQIAAPCGVVASGKVRSVYWGVHSKESSNLLQYISKRVLELGDLFKHTIEYHSGDYRKIADTIWHESEVSFDCNWPHPPSIQLTGASASSSMLSRVIYRLLFGSVAYEMEFGQAGRLKAKYASNSEVQLLIGDEALQKYNEFGINLDLSEIWHQLTELPFVFAVWQGKKKLPMALADSLMECAELAEAKMHVQPSTYYLPNKPVDTCGNSIDLKHYWSLLRYRLTPTDQKGLLLYLSLSKNLLPDTLGSNALTRIARWQQKLQNSSHI